ncbi:HTTM domain-containing protein [Flavobacteriales bacterium]|nr:HTTM domain-containing protein [Flavobacteriales bacterium]
MQITTAINKWIKHFSDNTVNIAPLITFRIVFGLMMFASTLRFILKGWINDFYVTPKYYFTYYGFDWVKPLEENSMYLLFGILLLSSLLIAFGFFYRISIVLFFLVFTYIELIDKTNYLNHYYFISLMSFILIFLPLNRHFSIDVYFRICKEKTKVPSWTINFIKLQIAFVYIFAGISKLNYNWLIEAQPLINWLKHQSDFPIIGSLLLNDITAYLFSWGGAIFDLFIVFILLSKRWRIYGYILVVIFHLLTSIMFPIGVFPLVMIGSTLIYFDEKIHLKIINLISRFTLKINESKTEYIYNTKKSFKPIYKMLFVSFFILQLVLPLRYLMYPGKLFWTEQGYRFSWRVMLIEKAGYAQFYIHEPVKDRKMLIENRNYLTPQQEKMMATQPDMILQFAHHISNTFKDSIIIERNGEIINLGKSPKVTADIKVSLFNKGSRSFIDNNINLTGEKRGFSNKSWILPYED